LGIGESFSLSPYLPNLQLTPLSTGKLDDDQLNVFSAENSINIALISDFCLKINLNKTTRVKLKI
jgi:hypothetical protein